MKLSRHLAIVMIFTAFLIALFCTVCDPLKIITPVKTIYFNEPNKPVELPNREIVNLDNWNNHHFYNCSETDVGGYLLYNFSATKILGAQINAIFAAGSDGEFSVSYSLDNKNYEKLIPVKQLQGRRQYVLDFRNEKNQPTKIWLKTNLYGKENWCNLVSYSAEIYSQEGLKKNAMSVAGIFCLFLIGALCGLNCLVYIHSRIMKKIFYLSKEQSDSITVYVISITSLFLIFPILRVLFAEYFKFDIFAEIYSFPLFAWRMFFLTCLFGVVGYSTSFTFNNIYSKVTEYKIALFLLLLCFFYGVFWFLSNTVSGDGSQYYAWMRSILIDHDIDFKNEAEYIAMVEWGSGVWKIIPTRLGTPLVWMPLYLLTHLIVAALNIFKFTYFEANGWSLPYYGSVTFTTLIASFSGLALSYKLLRRYFCFSVAMFSAIVIYLGTPIFTWTFVHPSYTHAIDFFVVTLYVYYWIITFNNRTYKQWAILGLIFFLLVMVREQNIIFGAMLVLEALLGYYTRNKNKFEVAAFIRGPITFMLVFLGGMFVLAIFSWWGGFLHNFLRVADLAQSDPNMSFMQTAKSLLFYPTTGILAATPLVIVSIAGIAVSFWSCKKYPGVLIFTIISMLLVLIAEFICASLIFNSYGMQFNLGGRYFINATLLFMVGLGVLLEHTSKFRVADIVLKIIIWLQVVYHLFLNIQYQGHIISYLGTCPPFKQILSQQINQAYKIIPYVVTTNIFWSQEKIVSYFTKLGKLLPYYVLFLIVLFFICRLIFRKIMKFEGK